MIDPGELLRAVAIGMSCCDAQVGQKIIADMVSIMLRRAEIQGLSQASWEAEAINIMADEWKRLRSLGAAIDGESSARRDLAKYIQSGE